MTSPVIPLQPVERVKHSDLSRGKYYNRNFSGCDLSSCKMNFSMFYQCVFDQADMSNANCEGSDFTGSSFRDTICYRTNFKDAKLATTIFEPKDCFGMTLTLQCKTFENIKVSQIWWLGFLFFATMMIPAERPIKEPFKDNLIAMIGPERWAKLRSLFGKREF